MKVCVLFSNSVCDCARRVWQALSVLLAMLVGGYAGWLMVRCFAVDYFSIPSGSMLPTLKPGDKVFVNKLIMGARIYTDFDFKPDGNSLESIRMKGIRRLRHNDIVVFNYPYHNGKLNFVINHVYCKRVVALPGDSVAIEEGCYNVNNYKKPLGSSAMQRKLSAIPDSMIPKQYLAAYPYDTLHFCNTIRNMRPMYVPRKGDTMQLTPHSAVMYKLLIEWETGLELKYDWNRNAVWIGGRRTVWHTFRNNYYFMAGDNVMDSNDSRYWGLVPEDYIVGVVEWILRK